MKISTPSLLPLVLTLISVLLSGLSFFVFSPKTFLLEMTLGIFFAVAGFVLFVAMLIRRIGRKKKRVNLMVALFFCLCYPPAAGNLQAAEKVSFISGSLQTRYRLRTTGEISDHDLDEIITLKFGDPTFNTFSGAIQGGAIIDLDGHDNTGTFSDIYNSFSSRAVGRLYYGYFDVSKVAPISRLRAGRQHVHRLEPLYFDGVSVETLPYAGFTLNAFAGAPVHLFENQIGIDPGDWTVGGGLQWNPVSALRFRFDATHLRDKVSAFRLTQRDLEDNLFGASLWFDLTKNLDFFSRFTFFDDQVRDIEGASTIRFPNQDLTFRLKLYRLLKAIDIRVIEWDAYGIAGTHEPYNEFQFSVTKGLGKHFAVDSGFAIRRLDNAQIAGAFNHGYERVFLSLASSSFPVKNLDLNLAGDYYHGEDNTLRNDNFGLSFSANQQLLKKRLKLGVGTAYYLYRYNLLSGNESDNVRTYFTSIEAKVLKPLRIKTTYEVEDNRTNFFHSVKTSLIWEF